MKQDISLACMRTFSMYSEFSGYFVKTGQRALPTNAARQKESFNESF